MTRRWIWLQLLVGWLPLGALFTLMIYAAHGDASLHEAVYSALRMIIAGAALGLVVQKLIERWPWPRPVHPRFVLLHLAAASVFSLAWLLANSVLESLVRGRAVIILGIGFWPYFILGMWLYVMVAGVAYTVSATDRAAQAEAAAAEARVLATQARLSALRAQLNPHFFFNALHTVVQLIPREPRRAADAAELLAGLLRSTLEDDRDLVPLRDELAFVRRYVELEQIRFGERLRVHVDVPDEALDVPVPSFAVLTLVENAIRHGAAPRVEPTDVSIAATAADGLLMVTVRDSGAGASPEAIDASQGTGLRRLRRRLESLHGGSASIRFDSKAGVGFTVTIHVPIDAAD